MKRRQPFNEIRAMGHIIEGMVINEPPVQYVAECQHGHRWREGGLFYDAENSPPIKDDNELLRILRTIDSSYNELRLSRLRRHMQSETIEKLEKGHIHKERKRVKKITPVRQEYIKQLQESYKPEPLVKLQSKIEGPDKSWLEKPQTYVNETPNSFKMEINDKLVNISVGSLGKYSDLKYLFQCEREDG